MVIFGLLIVVERIQAFLYMVGVDNALGTYCLSYVKYLYALDCYLQERLDFVQSLNMG